MFILELGLLERNDKLRRFTTSGLLKSVILEDFFCRSMLFQNILILRNSFRNFLIWEH